MPAPARQTRCFLSLLRRTGAPFKKGFYRGSSIKGSRGGGGLWGFEVKGFGCRGLVFQGLTFSRCFI